MKAAASCAVTIVQLASAAMLHAQPWVPPRGEGSVSVTYQNYYTLGHFNVAGEPNTNGATHSKAMMTEVDVGLTDTIALSVSLPFISTKYTGPDEYLVGGVITHPGPLDLDRRYHGAFQDVRAELRRLWWAGPVAIAPLVGISLPTHDYETRGEAVVGRHRRELQVGVTAGADLNRILPRSYVHGRYAVARGQRIEGFPSLTSQLNVEGGVEPTSRFGIRGIAGWQFRHQGPTIPELARHDWLGHDRFIVSSYFNLGAGVNVSLTRNTELHAVWIATVSGRSGAHRARMLAIGTAWRFGPGGGGFGDFGEVSAEPSRSTPRPAGSGT
ncbi:MAG TPA: hypothetical protein VFK57_13155 [Vicinamibacterales bacterium]|nr:hypothetical protein [Vicinamibacterales bacterium]